MSIKYIYMIHFESALASLGHGNFQNESYIYYSIFKVNIGQYIFPQTQSYIINNVFTKNKLPHMR